MSKFDVRRQRIATEGQIDRANLQSVQNVTDSILKGAELANNIANQIGAEQGRKHNEGKYDYVYGEIAKEDFYFDENGNPLSTDDALAKFRGLMEDYDKQNPPPTNPWAQQAIKSADDNMYEANRRTIVGNQVKFFEQWQDNGISTAIYGSSGSSGDSKSSAGGIGEVPGIINDDYTNPTGKIEMESALGNWSLASMPDYERGLYEYVMGDDIPDFAKSPEDVTKQQLGGSISKDGNIADNYGEFVTANTSKILNTMDGAQPKQSGYRSPDGSLVVSNKTVAAQQLMVIETNAKFGKSREEGIRQAIALQNTFARNDFIKNMSSAYSSYVLNQHEMTDAAFESFVSDALDGIVAGGKEGFNRSLNEMEKKNLLATIMSDASSLKATYQKDQLAILNDKMMPVLKEREKDIGYITSDTFGTLSRQYGLDFNGLPEESRTALETMLVNNDTLKESETAYSLLEQNAQSTKSEEEKQIEYDRIMSNLSYGARGLLESIEDDTKLTGKYAIVTSGEMVSDLRKTFSIVSQTDFIGNAEQDPQESMTVSEHQLQELTENPAYANDFVSMAAYYTEKKNGMPVVFSNRLHINGVDAFLDTLSEEERADAEKGLGRIYEVNEATGQRELIGYASASKEWEDRYYKWFDEQCAHAASFVAVYGSKNIGSQTLSSLYNETVSDLNRHKKTLAAGYIVDPTEDESLESSQSSSMFINTYLGADNDTRKDYLELLTHDRKFMMQFTKEDQEKIRNVINDDIVAYGKDKGFDINEMIKNNMPAGLDGTYIGKQVKASVLSSITMKDIDASTGDTLEGIVKDKIQNFTNAMYRDNIVQLESGETYSGELDSFKDYYKEYITDDLKSNINKLLYGDNRLEGIDQLLVDLNTNYGFDFDALIHKAENSGLWAKFSDLDDSERFLMSMALINNIDYNPGENDDEVWDDITRLADLNGNLWLESNSIAAQAITQYADGILGIENLPYIGLTPIAYNGNDISSVLAELPDGKQVSVSIKTNTKGDVVDYIVDTDITGEDKDRLPFEKSPTETSLRDLGRIEEISMDLAKTIDLNRYRGYDPVLEPERYSAEVSEELTGLLYQNYPDLPKAYKLATGNDLIVHVDYPNIVWIDPVEK